MLKGINKYISISFYLLLFTVPLVLFHKTSELFEFNKIIVTYTFTTIITSLWVLRMAAEKRVIFRRTLLDIPLILFLIGQILSVFLSIDTRTSFFGYYTRFHGGFLSSLSYSLLYWAFVSNAKKEEAIKSLFIIFISAILVSFYAVLEHFGIDKNIWIQDVQNRVFSTLGQPNWLAAWIIPLIPLSWAFAMKAERDSFLRIKIPGWFFTGLSFLFFLTLVYTKSRSGYLGFAVIELVFWSLVFATLYRHKESLKKVFKYFLVIHLIIIMIISITGTPWTKSASILLRKTDDSGQNAAQPRPTRPALEVERYDSGKIRQIVWRGALDIWKNYPIFGSGVETFAYSYYQFRPVEHNLVSEWDFLYNKAHNEYLNFLATTGTVGTFTYLTLVSLISYLFIKKSEIFRTLRKQSKVINSDDEFGSYLSIAFLSGFSSILVTNFFGFSVVPVAFHFFLFPAIAITLSQQKSANNNQNVNTEVFPGQKIIFSLIFLVCFYSLFLIGKYWYADYVYAQGRGHADVGNFLKSRDYLNSAVNLSPKESIFWDELAQTNGQIAIALSEEGNDELAKQLATEATAQTERAVELSPANINLKRTQASIFINMSSINPNFLLLAKNTLEEAIESAPTEAKLIYNLGLTYARLGDIDKAKEIFYKTIELKSNYKNPYYALGVIYADEGEQELARQQFTYILENINPEDAEVKRQLDELGN